jgi:hypothetical protein
MHMRMHKRTATALAHTRTPPSSQANRHSPPPPPPQVDALQPVINVVPLQLLSYHLTTLRCALNLPTSPRCSVSGVHSFGHWLRHSMGPRTPLS